MSFQSALDQFLAEKDKTRRPETAANHRARLNQHFPFKCQIGEIRHSDVLRRLAKIDTNAEHDHALSVAKTFFTWAHNRRYIDDNPTRGLSPRGTQSRSRVLSDEEIVRIWEACDQRGGDGGKIETDRNRRSANLIPPSLPATFAPHRPTSHPHRTAQK
jgi:integrase